MNLYKKIGLIGTLASTIIGAGVFSLPYIFIQAGVYSGLFFLFFFFVVYSCIHYMDAEIVIENKNLEFGSIVKKYLGPFGSIVQWTTIGELILVCTAYLIIAPEFFNILFGEYTAFFVFLFWIFGIFGMMLSMKWIEILETIGLFGIIIFIGIVGFLGWKLGTFSYLTTPDVRGDILVLFGPLLFALSGRPIIGRIAKSVGAERKKNLTSIIIWGTGIPAISYLVYTFGALAIYPNPTSGAIDVINQFPYFLPILLSIFGIVALWTSYFVIGLHTRDIFVVDVGLNKKVAFFIAAAIPIILYWLGVNEFVRVISFVGGSFLAIEGISIIFVWWKLKKRDKKILFALGTLLVVFLVAMAQEIKTLIW